MIQGLWEHWVPSADGVSTFWKTPVAKLREPLERLLDEMPINTFNFYSKWYTNGIRSELPYLINHPDSMNVRTDNDWGRELIAFFHARDVAVTFSLQLYTFPRSRMASAAILGEWPDLTTVTGTDEVIGIVNPLWEGYPPVLADVLDEQLRLFPDVDGLYLEFEGLTAVGADNPLRDAFPGQVAAATRALWEDAGMPEGQPEWVWTDAVQAVLKEQLQQHLGTAETVMTRRGFQGSRGLIYYALGYEVPYAEAALPSKDWLLMPWQYWGWLADQDMPETQIQRQLDFCQREMTRQADSGHQVCYIGNATLPTKRMDTIATMMTACRDQRLAGHIGMGDFIPEYGLRWHGADEASVLKARNLYQTLLAPKQAVR